ncbi:MAG: class II aldolase/adducin family protein, partial [Chloroflexota bacterium]
MKTAVAVRADLTLLIARASRAMAVAGLFDMHGHISVRDGEVTYINDRRSSRATLRPDQVAVVRIADGTAVHGEPPSETALHLACYRARADVGSVAHFHPLFATAFATAG